MIVFMSIIDHAAEVGRAAVIEEGSLRIETGSEGLVLGREDAKTVTLHGAANGEKELLRDKRIVFLLFFFSFVTLLVGNHVFQHIV